MLFIQQRQDALLKRLSQARGLSEAEIIRRAIEREVAGVPVLPVATDRSAWQKLVAFLESRQESATGGQPYRWNREEIYTERENRWLPDRER